MYKCTGHVYKQEILERFSREMTNLLSSFQDVNVFLIVKIFGDTARLFQPFRFRKIHIDVYRIRRYRKLENISNLLSDLLFIHGITFALSRARQAVFSGPTVKRMRL